MKRSNHRGCAARSSCFGWRLLITGLSLVIFVAGTVRAVYAAPYQLTVNKGYGGGVYESSSIARISAFPYDTTDPAASTIEPADPTAPVRVFDRWSGDTAGISDIRARNTTMIMPSKNCSITAEFKDIPRWKLPRMILAIPEAPVGVIYLFHGSGGGIAGLLINQEFNRFMDLAAASSFAVVVIESYERKDGFWDIDHASAADNIDMQRVAQVHSQLKAKGKISDLLPVYCLGISRGAMFATMLADQTGQGNLPFTVRAVASYISPGSRDALARMAIPVVFMVARNDDMMDVSLALSSFDLLIERGVASQLWVLEPTPVHSGRFWGIPGLTQSDSETIQNGLKAKGMLDAGNFLLPSAFRDANNDGVPDWYAAVPAGYESFLTEIANELTAADAGHVFFSDLSDKTFGFFMNPATVIDEVPVISGFSPLSGPEGTVVTVTGGNFVDVHGVAFNGIPASRFSIVYPTTLTAVVPAGATTGAITVSNSAGTATSSSSFAVSGAPPHVNNFSPAWGRAGTVLVINGSNFTGATSVLFSGTAASFAVLSDTQITATVPVGASTGKITVMTPAGSAVSMNRFWVF